MSRQKEAQPRDANKPRNKWIFVAFGLLCLLGIGRSFSMPRKLVGPAKRDDLSVTPPHEESSMVIPTTSSAPKCGTSDRLIARTEILILVAGNRTGMPKSPELEQFQTADYLIYEGNYSQAIRVLNNAINSHPKCPELISLRGYAFLHQENRQQAIKDFESAQDAFEKAIERGDKQPITLTNLGSIFIELGKLKGDKKIFQKAEKVLREALKLPGCPSETWCELAELLELRGRAVEALGFLSGHVKQAPTNSVLGTCYQDLLHREQQRPRSGVRFNRSPEQPPKHQPPHQGR